MSGRVVHCKHEPFDVYIGRPSKWGNPFKLPKGYDVRADPDRILPRYAAYLRESPALLAALPELRGKVLACWCAPKPCHGDVLLEAIAALDHDPACICSWCETHPMGEPRLCSHCGVAVHEHCPRADCPDADPDRCHGHSPRQA